ncbi:MAG: hypothetical protein AB7J19_01970 [Beijerinckiaceae bacterium]
MTVPLEKIWFGRPGGYLEALMSLIYLARLDRAAKAMEKQDYERTASELRAALRHMRAIGHPCWERTAEHLKRIEEFMASKVPVRRA